MPLQLPEIPKWRLFQATTHNTYHFRGSEEEPRKPVIEKSFRVALRRCAVHIAPMMISGFILYLNLKGHYIGTTFPTMIKSETINLVLLQIAAKAHELLILASLTTIIFSMSRYELLFGNGLPLGLIGCGLSFGNITHFFSKEFVGSVYYTGNNRRKAQFVFTLVTAGVIASLSGPCSAVLMVPKGQNVFGGGTSFYLAGSRDEIWPRHVDTNMGDAFQYCNGSDAVKYAICPSGGFHSLWDRFGQGDVSIYPLNRAMMPRVYAKKLSGSSFYWALNSPLSLVPPLLTFGNNRYGDRSESSTFLIQPHAASSVILQQITSDWWQALMSRSKNNSESVDDRVAQSIIPTPLTRVKCSEIRTLKASSRDVEFPVVQPGGTWKGASRMTVDTLEADAVDHLRFRWIHLPEEVFGPTTIGSIFESPWSSGGSREVIGCSLQATWVNATIFTDKYTFWSGWYAWNIQFNKPYPPWVTPESQKNLSRTNGRIGVSESWLKLLTPTTPPEGPSYYSWHPTTIESILINAGLQTTLSSSPQPNLTSYRLDDSESGSRRNLLELIICSVFEDGISRWGSHRVYNISGQPSNWNLSLYQPRNDFSARVLAGKDAFKRPDPASGNYTRLRVEMSISGYAYHGTLAEKLAMAVLFTHIIFVLVHSCWILYQSKTSDSWDSVSKIITLAHNSEPSLKALENSSAGIDRLRTFSRSARIRATSQPNTGEMSRVQLIFQDASGAGPEQQHDYSKDWDERSPIIERAPDEACSQLCEQTDDTYNDISLVPIHGPSCARHAKPSGTTSQGLSAGLRCSGNSPGSTSYSSGNAAAASDAVSSPEDPNSTCLPTSESLRRRNLARGRRSSIIQVGRLYS